MPNEITEATTQIYNILFPLEPDARARVIRACTALLGDTLRAETPSGATQAVNASSEDSARGVGPKAQRWLQQNRISADELQQVFMLSENGNVQVIASSAPGTSNKDRVANVYVLCGLRTFLRTDTPSIDNAEAIELARTYGCYDRSNHGYNRNSLGNRVSGSAGGGFVLTAPGLAYGAELLKAIAGSPAAGR